MVLQDKEGKDAVSDSSSTASTLVADCGDVAGQAHWRSFWGRHRPQQYTIPPLWHAVVRRYLPVRCDWTVLEIGCVPGGLLVYFHQQFGYQLAGIDYTPRLDLVQATLKFNGAPRGALQHVDFFEWMPETLYDVVFSNGFIEHFEDHASVVRRHADLVAPGGYLVLIVPNYTHVQYAMHCVFDRSNLGKHRFDVMDPVVLRADVEASGLDVQYCNYAVTFDFWIVQRGTGVRRWLAWFCEGLAGRLERLLAKLSLGQMPNRYLSPFVVCVARRDGADA